MADPITLADPNEEDYASSEDEDFNPEATGAGEEDVSSSSEDEDTEGAKSETRKTAQKRKQDDLGELDSGDEEVRVEQSKRKKKRAGKADDEDSGGEGGLIKTRAQRKAEKQERREARRVNKEDVTIDVDALWAKLKVAPVGRRPPPVIQVLEQANEERSHDTDAQAQEANEKSRDMQGTGPAEEDEFIMITQSYEFAGHTVNEEKRVHRDSAEAKLFLASQDPSKQTKAGVQLLDNGLALRRPLKRASMFEPNPRGEVKGLPDHRQRLRTPSRTDVLAMQKRLEQEADEKKAKAQRLNTVQKSALDWASHVDKEGLKDELTEYGKSKQGYMAKMDFLRDVQGKRDQEERRARLQGT